MTIVSLFSTTIQVNPPIEPAPTGLEWMVVASVVVPALLLVVLIYLGTRRTV